MNRTELRQRLQLFRSQGYSLLTPLIAPEYKLRWEFERLQGISTRDQLIKRGFSRLIAISEEGEERIFELNGTSRRSPRLLEAHGDRLIEFLQDPIWIGSLDFRGYISFD
ncbi:hypothetical protein VF14_08815 [Nostoc linckia z18]|uniref:Uncharacterized protein n=2 Tax=Nostoc linckia TaxID=92942 RepID=A0A9Q5ZEL4_NOSLI|nr:hypothetical protein [Nostoc linckia]PHJ59568.1 hypothetical protein VF02_24440 [Nostoc linckia z1]PHJ65154.1 hypothetical protein VF05_21710 [Nostoc linckia z3]PHJ69572.1 hypothetical protein VF03_23520 [Nostoc linckia z2]PHJ83617.1 hypothetical protein VF06_12235 [Nostoc linckia z4]PHJ86269.1 hypothetical protein VF07_22165 [Nostoc linckia z6]PHJ96286.1 hypothetical protein VF04_16485 [Nostoc linckia z7]PHK05335.1 hypothetical protein VF08_08120 [Nostoc linckia z8]PHK12450.1 hypothetic